MWFPTSATEVRLLRARCQQPGRRLPVEGQSTAHQPEQRCDRGVTITGQRQPSRSTAKSLITGIGHAAGGPRHLRRTVEPPQGALHRHGAIRSEQRGQTPRRPDRLPRGAHGVRDVRGGVSIGAPCASYLGFTLASKSTSNCRSAAATERVGRGTAPPVGSSCTNIDARDMPCSI